MLESVLWWTVLAWGTFAQIPDEMIGTWVGQMVTAPFGPGSVEHPLVLEIARDGKGGFYIFHPETKQLMMTRDNLMQYCFGMMFFQGAPAPGLLGASVVAPYEVSSVTHDEVVFQWRGQGSPIHPTGCKGADCSYYSLHLDGNGTLRATVMMSGVVQHMNLELTRRSFTPDMSELLLPSPCEKWVDKWNPLSLVPYLGPVLVLNQSSAESVKDNVQRTPICPLPGFAHGLKDDILKPPGQKTGDDLSHCLRLSEALDIRLEYTPSELPCMPCDVKFKFSGYLENPVASAAVPGRKYLAIGFRGGFYSYSPMISTPTNPTYWGMNTSPDEDYKKPISGHIVLGYPLDGNSPGCVRDMEALGYVGTPTDRVGPSPLQNSTVEFADGRISISFAVNMNFAETEKQLDPFNGNFFDSKWIGTWRIMWAVGSVGSGGCEAPIKYHANMRGIAPLYWPTNVWCPAD